jgi:hypothetical protein
MLQIAKLTEEAGLKQIKAMILVTFSVPYLVGQLRGSDKTKKLTPLRPVQR